MYLKIYKKYVCMYIIYCINILSNYCCSPACSALLLDEIWSKQLSHQVRFCFFIFFIFVLTRYFTRELATLQWPHTIKAKNKYDWKTIDFNSFESKIVIQKKKCTTLEYKLVKHIFPEKKLYLIQFVILMFSCN